MPVSMHVGDIRRGVYVDARNDGWVVNRKKIQRLWSEEGLRVVVRRRRKRVGVADLPTITKAAAPRGVWAIDFPFDKAMAGKPFKILSIVDEHTREALGGKVEYSITAEDLIDQLDVLVIERGMPKALRMDNGPVLIQPYSSRKPFANGLSRWTWCLFRQGNLGGIG
jgi:transposase InsO family protein